MPSYAFIAKDYTTQAALYTHHQYIAIFADVRCLRPRCDLLHP